MSEKSLSVGVTIEPLVGSLIGAAVGYSLAPRKYTVKNLISTDKDTFERIYPENVIKGFSKEEKEAFTNILEARKTIENLRTSNDGDIRQKTDIWKKLYNKIEIPEELKSDCAEKKAQLDRLMRENNYSEVSTEYKRLQQALKNHPNDAELKAQFAAAENTFSNITVKLHDAINAYRPLVQKIALEKRKQLKEHPEKYLNITEAANNIQAACAERQTLMINKLFEICNASSIKNSYETLKFTIPKARVKAAVTGAIILGSLSAIFTHIMNKSIAKGNIINA